MWMASKPKKSCSILLEKCKLQLQCNRAKFLCWESLSLSALTVFPWSSAVPSIPKLVPAGQPSDTPSQTPQTILRPLLPTMMASPPCRCTRTTTRTRRSPSMPDQLGNGDEYVHCLAELVQILNFKYVQLRHVYCTSINLFKASLNSIILVQVYL